MKTAAILLLLPLAAFADAQKFRELPLPEVKAVVQIPADWKSTSESDEGVFVYHLGKNPESQGASTITLSVTPKVPDRTGQSPAQYAEALIDMSKEEGGTVQKGQANGLDTFRSEYAFDADNGRMRAVNIALANAKTGTLYFFAWQGPLDEPAELEALRERVVSSAKFDPAF